jgi:hypothetical protein
MRYGVRWGVVVVFAVAIAAVIAPALAQTGGFLPDALEGRWQSKSGAITFGKTPAGWSGTFDDFRQSFPPLKNVKFNPATGEVSFTTPPGSLGQPEMRWVGTVVRNTQSNGCSIVGTLTFDYLEGKTIKHHSQPFEASSTYVGKGVLGKGYKSRCFSKAIPGVTPTNQPEPQPKPQPKPEPQPQPQPEPPARPDSFLGNWRL